MVTADNVGSFQMQQVRMALRGEAVVCFGKNTMMRRVLKNFLEQNKGHDYSKIMSSLQGNTGLVFTNCPDLGKIKQIIVENVVPAPARAAMSPTRKAMPANPIPGGEVPRRASSRACVCRPCEPRAGGADLSREPRAEGRT